MKPLLTLMFHDVFAQDPAESGFSGVLADRYKLSRGAFVAQLDAIAATRSDAPVLVTQLASHSGKQVPFALSFDDGGVSYYTQVAELLDARGWRGHCFVTTGRLGRPGFLNKQQLRELHAAGHLIGTHSASHAADFDRCSPQQLLQEWTRSKAELEDITGSAVLVGSIPGGCYSAGVAAAASAAGLTSLFSSEPRVQAWQVAQCGVFGRYTLRQSSAPDLAGALVATAPWPRWRQALEWNSKKLLKSTMGSSYRQVSRWLARHGN